MEALHSPGIAMDEFQHRIAKFKISDPEARPGFMFIVMPASKVRFVEFDRPIDIGDVQCNMIYALKHSIFSQFLAPDTSIGRAWRCVKSGYTFVYLTDKYDLTTLFVYKMSCIAI